MFTPDIYFMVFTVMFEEQLLVKVALPMELPLYELR
jgi:hypothetical protein